MLCLAGVAVRYLTNMHTLAPGTACHFCSIALAKGGNKQCFIRKPKIGLQVGLAMLSSEPGDA